MKTRKIAFLGFLLLILLVIVAKSHRWDNPYNRIILGDAKGYYAYLPALFIYGDFSYSFVDEMEKKYYPEDGSAAKNFRIEQPNGTVANKCFPGASIFYFPFFALAAIFSYLAGLPVDGYSVLFQWSVVASHLFFILWGCWLLLSVMKKLNFDAISRYGSVLVIIFASNIYYYLVYDFTVVHVFGFFGCSLLIWLCHQYKWTDQWKFIGWCIPVLALLLIMRPTNLMMVLVFPLFLSKEELKRLISPKNWKWLNFFIGGLILFIAPLMWKLQTGNWLVYSYGEESMNLLQPHLIDYLFSYKKGWLLWSPFLFIAILMGIIYFFKEGKIKGFLYFFGILGIAYVFSCWWIWTFGMGLGQRPMIDFYPILLIGIAGFLNRYKQKIIYIAFLPFIVLNVVQAFQMKKGILTGGTTTKESYWSHFLQVKRDPPTVEIKNNWKKVFHEKKQLNEEIYEKNPFSSSIQFLHPFSGKAVVTLTIGGKHEGNDAVLVVADDKSQVYQAHYLQAILYKKPRKISYLFEIDNVTDTPVKCYLWNINPNEKVSVVDMEITLYEEK